MIVFGGWSGGRRNDVWVLENANGLGGASSWTNTVAQGAGGSPSSRRYHSTVYAAGANRLVLFGGDDGAYRNDLWLLTNANGLGGSSVWSNPIADGAPGSPTRRYGSSVVYDGANDRMILFGGLDNFPVRKNDVWVLDNASGAGATPSWTQLSPSGTLPAERHWSSADYDEANNRLVLFGGNGVALRNDVWVLTNANGLGGTPAWLNTVPNGAAGSPTTRYGHRVVYDGYNNRIVLFAGYDTTTYQGDLWVLENANGLGGASKWTRTGAGIGTAGPSPRVQHTAVFSAPQRRLIAFGGLDTNGDRNDVWVLTNASDLDATPWHLAIPHAIPGSANARFAHTAVYSDAEDRMILFGGSTSPTLRNDVWILQNATGVEAQPSWSVRVAQGAPGSPSGRFHHAAVYDDAADRMVVFGGWDSGQRKNDTWVLENASGKAGTAKWTNLIAHGAPGSPSPRYRHSAVYHAASNRMVMFGGHDGIWRNDLWVLENANGLGGAPGWTNLIPDGTPGSPEPRHGHTAVYDEVGDRMIVFGGDYTVPRNDVWVLAEASGSGGTPSWANTMPHGALGSPPARYWHAAAYDEVENRMMVFGGYTNYMNDLWVLSDANGQGGTSAWTEGSPLGTPQSPTPRFSASAVYNSSENRLVLFGGSDGAVRNDLWILYNANGSPVMNGSVLAPESGWLVGAAALAVAGIAAGKPLLRRGPAVKDVCRRTRRPVPG
jgi:hypothetical protein